MRDRLVALINEAKDEYPTIPSVNCYKPTFAYYLADHLLANGVILPPCKVGDTLYYCIDLGDIVHGQVLEIKVLSMEMQEKMRFYAKTVKHYRYNYTRFDSTDIGKTVFFTREEAEQALKGEHNG